MTPLLGLLILLWGGFIVLLVLGVTTQAADRLMRKRLEGIAQLEEEVAEYEEEELKQPFAQRTIVPILKRFGDRLGKNAEKLGASQIAELLEQAGYPWGMQVPHFLGLKLLCVLIFLGIALIAGPLTIYYLGKVPAVAGAVGRMRMLISGVFLMLPIVGFMVPNLVLERVIRARHKQMKRALPDTVDLLVLAMEAGMAFDGAVGEAVKAIEGPLSDELARVLAEVAHGKERSEAFRDLAERTRMAELSLLVAAIDQAEKMGVGLAQALRAQATELRERHMMAAKEKAAKLPVKMMIPLVVFIFPALFVVILGPAAIQVSDMMKQGVF